MYEYGWGKDVLEAAALEVSLEFAAWWHAGGKCPFCVFTGLRGLHVGEGASIWDFKVRAVHRLGMTGCECRV